MEVVAAPVVKDHGAGLGRLGRDVAGVAQRPEILPGAVAVVELLLGGLEGREALPAVSGGPVLQLLAPGHADGPSSASPGEVVVGQLEKVVQHGADGVVLVAVPLVVREPQPQLLGWHVAAAADSDVAGRGRDGLSGRCCRPRSGERALRARRPSWRSGPCTSGDQAGQLQPPLPPSPASRARFVDSMNVFPTSLASMIDDLRACTHKQLPELFPLMASLHPELQLRTPTGSPPQRRPLKQRRTHCELEQAWDCILRKLPIFEHFCGAEAWEMPAVWEQHCYDSVLAGKAVSAEDHRLAVNTANVMGWETFREFHDCYLHTDVLALADVMESYRHSFRAHYVTLPGADAAALGPQDSHSPHHRRAGLQGRAVMGGLSCIFQPFAQANNPELGEEDYNPEEPVSWISYLDLAVALPEDNAARLSWLHETCLSSLNWESDAEE